MKENYKENIKATKTLTYDEIVNGALEKLPKSKDKNVIWEAHIATVKNLSKNVHLNRMIIAEIAERACLIFWGGDVKTADFKKHHQPHTLKAFAKKAKINYHTLNIWVNVKKRVFVHLPPKLQKNFKFTAGERAGKTLYRNFRNDKKEPTVDEIVSVYSELAEPSACAARSLRMKQYLRQAHFWFVKKDGLIDATEDDLIEYRRYAREILEKIGQIDKILKLKPVVMVRKRKLVESEATRPV